MKNRLCAKFLTAATVLICAGMPSDVWAEATSATPPPSKQSSTMLSADTPLANIHEYQSFFKDMANQPYLQVASPKTAYMWQHMSRLFRTTMILRDGEISNLPVKINPAVASLAFERKNKGMETVGDHFTKRSMDAMIIIHKGTIAFEEYKSMRPFDKHNWFSSGKVISSTLIGLIGGRKQNRRQAAGQPLSAGTERLRMGHCIGAGCAGHGHGPGLYRA